MSTTLALFWHLSSASKKERIDASVKLVGALDQFQSQFVPADYEGEDDATKPDALDALNAQDVSYSIRRLVRGLASPRQSSRLGFAVALSEVSVSCIFYFSFIIDFISLVIVSNRHSDMSPDGFTHRYFVPDPGFDDWSRSQRYALRETIWPHGNY